MQIREYARLTTDPSAQTGLDCGVVSEATFDWLVDVSVQWAGQTQIQLINDHRSMKLGSYVGYLQSPSGEAIEILPKTRFGPQSPSSARRILQNMLKASLGLKPRAAGDAELLRLNQPLHEWIFSQFLEELAQLLRRGLRSEYERIDDESCFIRGQLQIAKQQQQPPGRQHLFHISHDIFTPNRLENRLIATALSYILSVCKDRHSWQLANEFSHRLIQIPIEHQPLQRLPQWTHSKLMQSYESIKPWCELVLEKLNPNFQQGAHRGISLLFPMERLFEKTVEVRLGSKIQRPWRLKAQATREYLVTHQLPDRPDLSRLFQLKPDLLLESKHDCHVLDVKWKLLDQQQWQPDKKYGIDQKDLYQLFAYGLKYQRAQGHMMIIYPGHDRFEQTLSPFHYSDQLTLWAVPFSLETQQLIDGDWRKHFPFSS